MGTSVFEINASADDELADHAAIAITAQTSNVSSEMDKMCLVRGWEEDWFMG